MTTLKEKLRIMAEAAQSVSRKTRETHRSGRGDFSCEKWVYPLNYGDKVYLNEMHQVPAGLFWSLADRHGEELDIESLRFLDVETTGLYGSGVQAFLVGVGLYSGDTFHVHQLLMEDFSGETELLLNLADLCRDAKALVTFNGRVFDVPLLEARYAMNRMESPFPEINVDLLHPARRLWKIRLSSCALKNLEEKILGQRRVGDIDGSEIPGRYFQFLRSGNRLLLEDILMHNRLDVLSMPLIACAMANLLRDPTAAQEHADRYSAGRYYLRRGDSAVAEDCFSCVKDDYWLFARRELSLILKRQKRTGEAMEIWKEMTQLCPQDLFAHLEMAKVYEHRLKDIESAVLCCEKALGAQMNARELLELQARRARLKKKQQRQRLNQ